MATAASTSSSGAAGLASPFITPGSSYGSPGSGLAFQSGSGDSLTNFIRSIESLTGAQGQGILGAGLGQTEKGVAAADPALNFLTKLVSGNASDMASASQPETDQITQQFDQIRQMISTQPRGGGKASALAKAPYEETKQIADTQAQMRTDAAGQLGGLATSLAGIGLGEATMGAGLENESANIALTKEGQNYSQPSAFSQMLQAVDTFI